MEKCKTWADVKEGDIIYYFYIYEYEYTQYSRTPYKCVVKKIMKSQDNKTISLLVGESTHSKDLFICNPNTSQLDDNDWVYYCDKQMFVNELESAMQDDYENMKMYENDYNFKNNFLKEIND